MRPKLLALSVLAAVLLLATAALLPFAGAKAQGPGGDPGDAWEKGYGGMGMHGGMLPPGPFTDIYLRDINSPAALDRSHSNTSAGASAGMAPRGPIAS